MDHLKTADLLKVNESGIIFEISDSSISIKLMEMNCMPGESITLKHIAPLGDPLVFEIGNVLIGMRNVEASYIVTTKQIK